MKWSIGNKYRRIEDVSHEAMCALESKVSQCPWRQTFHVQPITGLLNDPNGFSYFNGEYHLFYQWHPLEPVHGLKYWYHTKSTDLVNWENAGIGIEPNAYFDSHGAYSGSAIEHNDELYLFYTGNTRDELFVRHPYQCMAVMSPSGHIEKLSRPVIDRVPNGYTDHFRDPKVWKEGNTFYAVIGAQRTNKTGCVVLYRSTDLINWTFEGEIKTQLDPFGYMWECPDYFTLQEYGVLIFSPQGLEAEGDQHQNIYQSGYVIGDKLDLSHKRFNHGDFQELDRGFDFYAAQTMLNPEGRRIVIGWMGLPDMEYPTDKNGWAHCLTLPRELSIKKGKLIQKPVIETHTLRQKEYHFQDAIFDEIKSYEGFSGDTYELISEFENGNASEFGIELRAGKEEKTVIKYNAITKKVILDRSLSGKPVGLDYGTERSCAMNADQIKFHVFVDRSSVEIFVNDGEEVFTARIFPDQTSQDIRFFVKNGSINIKATMWDY